NVAFSAQYYANNRNRFLLKAKVKENGFDHTFSIKDISTTIGAQNIESPYINNSNNGVPNVYYFV
ncbi:MAG TPA: hypothetical protein DCF44_06745, partial [Chitinophagaceae bacterium]|nr:hypothetical protein [Chitinophagaceae bacterium]